MRAPEHLSAVPHIVAVVFAYDGGFGAGGEATLLVDGSAVASARVERTVPLVFSMSGETFDIGIDTGSPVGSYRREYRCTASIIGVTIERLDTPSEDLKAMVREGLFQAGLSAH